MIPIDLKMFMHLFSFIWKDTLEITFFSFLFAGILHWLNKGSSKRLLFICYGYCATFGVAYTLHLPAITWFLALGAPIIGIFSIIMHQERLQQNFITAKTINPSTSTQATESWLDELFRGLLQTTHHVKEVTCIIEQHDALNAHLTSSLALQSPLRAPLLTMLIASPYFDPTKLIWINHQGMIRAVNVVENQLLDEQWLTEKKITTWEPWKRSALLYTTKTDALMIRTNTLTRTCTIVSQGSFVENITMHQGLQIIKKYLKHVSSVKQGEPLYEPATEKNINRQPYA